MRSLKARNNSLSEPKKQRAFLEEGLFKEGSLPYFTDKVASTLGEKISPQSLRVLQLNIGYMCNQVCAHCHVDAGPDRKEMMSRTTFEHCLEVMRAHPIETVDITGGAPEMHPDFRWFIEQIRQHTNVKDIIVRSNLTIIRANKKFFDLPEFFAKHELHIISSLPFYKRSKTDRQRGDGVFDQSILALQKLNDVGYGLPDSSLLLDLVYNPAGAFLPSDQNALEQSYKKSLKKEYNIFFNQLFTITNLPISRFLDYLIASENYEEYMHMLVEAFNPEAAKNVMCRHTLSVSWEGFLFDCDFNQMLDLKVKSPKPHVSSFNLTELQQREIQLHQHCFGCTAGTGSSCQGSTT